MYINRPRHLCIRTAHDMQRQAIKKAIMSSTRHQICIKSYVAIVWHDIIRENQTAKPDDPWSLQVWKKKETYIIGLDMMAKKSSHKGLVWMFFLQGIFFLCYILRVLLWPCLNYILERVPWRKTVTNGLGRLNFRRTTNAIVWGWDFNQCPVGSMERNKEELPGNNDCTRVDFQWG